MYCWLLLHLNVDNIFSYQSMLKHEHWIKSRDILLSLLHRTAHCYNLWFRDAIHVQPEDQTIILYRHDAYLHILRYNHRFDLNNILFVRGSPRFMLLNRQTSSRRQVKWYYYRTADHPLRTFGRGPKCLQSVPVPVKPDSPYSF